MNLDSIEGVERELAQLRRRKFEENLTHLSDEELLAAARSYASCGEETLKSKLQSEYGSRIFDKHFKSNGHDQLHERMPGSKQYGRFLDGNFLDFMRAIISFIIRHSSHLYIILSAVMVVLTIPLAHDYIVKYYDVQWYASIPMVVLYEIFIVGIVCCFLYVLFHFSENTSNTLNEDAFKFMILLVAVPLILLLFLLFLILKCAKKSREKINMMKLSVSSRSTKRATCCNDAICRLNELKEKKLITDEEYSKQLEKIINMK